MPDYMEKDPDDVLDYLWDFTSWLQPGELIASHVFIIPPELTLTDEQQTGTTVTAWLSGGIVRQDLLVTCRITTGSSPNARIHDRSIRFRITER